MCATVPSFYVGFEGSKLGLHVWVASTLLTEHIPSPEPTISNGKWGSHTNTHRCTVARLYESLTFIITSNIKLGVVARASDPSTREAQAGGLPLV